ncbi:hypothetical protein KCU88_g2919, partial [Aureobasidium melanogenum]
MPDQAHRNEAGTLLSTLKDDLEVQKLDQRQLEASLTKLKILGRDASNVSDIYDEDGVKVLGSYAFANHPPSVHQEAMRCIANALLLLPQTRSFALQAQLDQQAADALRTADVDEEFLLSRILFLLTLDPAIDLKTLISEHDLAKSIVKHLTRHAEENEKSKGQINQPAAMALQETLKLLFSATSAQTDKLSEFNPAVVEVLRLLNDMPVPSPPLQPPINLLVNALANMEFDEDAMARTQDIESGVAKLITILEQAIAKHPTAELDIVGVPLLTVLRKINEKGSPELRKTLKARLLPDDKERDQPLGKSGSLPSKLLQLTTSSGLLKLTEAISGLMFELSDKDANEYVKNVGYGYAAGYLMTHDIPIPESAKKTQQSGESSGSVPINPITGQRIDMEPEIELPKMTREEKEREAERLFVLFERLKTTGVVDVKNPVQQAMEEGRIEELSDSDTDASD